MKLLIDMNLSPMWVGALQEGGIEAVHWSTVGSGSSPDKEILEWAKASHYIVLTHDLDFGAILAATAADAPSVIQLRLQDVAPAHAKQLVIKVLNDFRHELQQGALVSIDEDKGACEGFAVVIPKPYQAEALDWLEAFFKRCKLSNNPASSYAETTKGLGNY